MNKDKILGVVLILLILALAGVGVSYYREASKKPPENSETVLGVEDSIIAKVEAQVYTKGECNTIIKIEDGNSLAQLLQANPELFEHANVEDYLLIFDNAAYLFSSSTDTVIAQAEKYEQI